MKKLLFVAIAAVVFASCEKKTDGAGSGDSSNTKTENKEEAPKEITLKEVKGEKLGFTIQIPEGAKELQNTDMGWTYSLVLDAMSEINVSVNSAGEIKDLDGAVKFTNFMAETPNEEQKADGDNFLVVKKAQGTMLQEFWYFIKGKNGYLAVKCTVPPAHAELAKKIVTSAKAI